ncbi:MAG TPA: hypothetical protein VHV47_11725 [Opitutaceae bacterium]|jgi:hypothetical protein|nr:hypothetical protein [Opitutaceae bacterium]
MKLALAACAALFAAAAPLRAQGPLETLDNRLAYSSADGRVRVRLSGTLDLEGYATEAPDPGLIVTDDRAPLFAPRLSAFLDAQIGPDLYVFGQLRVDRGFDPGYGNAWQGRLDELAVRYSLFGSGHLSLQVGKFATVVGNWAPRHGSWEDPFITAPLPYENLTGIWDTTAADSVNRIFQWAHVAPYPASDVDADKSRRLPILWGPSYTTGAALIGDAGLLRYAVEVKNASLSSRPDEWTLVDRGWSHPAIDARLALQPDEAWSVGLSAGEGPYLDAGAAPSVPAGRSFSAYREIVLGQDASYAWHHFQAWAELYEARFEVPAVANADTAAYYVEARYTFAPRFSAGLRWNQQIYAPLQAPAGFLAGVGPVPAHSQDWGAGVREIDFAPEYRLTAYVQLKVQLSLERGASGASGTVPLAAAQLTLRW